LPGTLAHAIKEEEKRKTREHTSFVAMASLPWLARKRCMTEIALQKVLTNPTALTFSEAFAIVEAEYVQALTVNRFSSIRPETSYSFSGKNPPKEK
jgi:hypothetical protein